MPPATSYSCQKQNCRSSRHESFETAPSPGSSIADASDAAANPSQSSTNSETGAVDLSGRWSSAYATASQEPFTGNAEAWSSTRAWSFTQMTAAQGPVDHYTTVASPHQNSADDDYRAARSRRYSFDGDSEALEVLRRRLLAHMPRRSSSLRLSTETTEENTPSSSPEPATPPPSQGFIRKLWRRISQTHLARRRTSAEVASEAEVTSEAESLQLPPVPRNGGSTTGRSSSAPSLTRKASLNDIARTTPSPERAAVDTNQRSPKSASSSWSSERAESHTSEPLSPRYCCVAARTQPRRRTPIYPPRMHPLAPGVLLLENSSDPDLTAVDLGCEYLRVKELRLRRAEEDQSSPGSLTNTTNHPKRPASRRTHRNRSSRQHPYERASSLPEELHRHPVIEGRDPEAPAFDGNDDDFDLSSLIEYRERGFNLATATSGLAISEEEVNGGGDDDSDVFAVHVNRQRRSRLLDDSVAETTSDFGTTYAEGSAGSAFTDMASPGGDMLGNGQLTSTDDNDVFTMHANRQRRSCVDSSVAETTFDFRMTYAEGSAGSAFTDVGSPEGDMIMHANGQRRFPVDNSVTQTTFDFGITYAEGSAGYGFTDMASPDGDMVMHANRQRRSRADNSVAETASGFEIAYAEGSAGSAFTDVGSPEGDMIMHANGRRRSRADNSVAETTFDFGMTYAEGSAGTAFADMASPGGDMSGGRPLTSMESAGGSILEEPNRTPMFTPMNRPQRESSRQGAAARQSDRGSASNFFGSFDEPDHGEESEEDKEAAVEELVLPPLERAYSSQCPPPSG